MTFTWHRLIEGFLITGTHQRLGILVLFEPSQNASFRPIWWTCPDGSPAILREIIGISSCWTSLKIWTLQCSTGCGSSSGHQCGATWNGPFFQGSDILIPHFKANLNRKNYVTPIHTHWSPKSLAPDITLACLKIGCPQNPLVNHLPHENCHKLDTDSSHIFVGQHPVA